MSRYDDLKEAAWRCNRALPASGLVVHRMTGTPGASETIVSQRGNTLQVPVVTPGLRTGNTGQMPKVRTGQTGQMPAARIAQRADEPTGGGLLQNQAILWAIGAVVLGIIGFVLIVAALNGG